MDPRLTLLVSDSLDLSSRCIWRQKTYTHDPIAIALGPVNPIGGYSIRFGADDRTASIMLNAQLAANFQYGGAAAFSARQSANFFGTKPITRVSKLNRSNAGALSLFDLHSSFYSTGRARKTLMHGGCSTTRVTQMIELTLINSCS